MPTINLDKYKLQNNLDKYKINSVNEFPKQEPESVKQSFLDRLGLGIKQGLQQSADSAVGTAKGAISTINNLSALGQKGLKAITSIVPNSNPSGISSLPESLTTPTESQKPAFTGEKIGEFLIPGNAPLKVENAINKGINTLSLGEKFGKGGEFLAKYLNLTGKMVTEGATSAGITTAQGGDINEVKRNAGIAALIPVAGAILSKGQEIASGLFEGVGKKIQTTVIKPSKTDLADGFRIDNVNKYDLGGNLETTFVKTQTKLSDLADRLRNTLGFSKETIDLNDIANATEKELIVNSAKNFGQNSNIKSVFTKLRNEISQVGNNGIVDLPTAQIVKQASGSQGAWLYGSADPEAKAVEKVYTKFYQKIKPIIEEASGASDEVKAINKQISELIPINNAVIRRLPVSQRNGILSLTDFLGLTATLLNPKAAFLEGANLLSKSGTAGKALVEVGKKIKPSESATFIGKRILGR